MRALLISHIDDGQEDGVSTHLAARGWRLDRVSPYLGQSLPPPGDPYALAVVYGGAESANDEHLAHIRAEIAWIREWVHGGRPFLGLCLGAQLLARALGARVARHGEGRHEIGYVAVEDTGVEPGFVPAGFRVYHWHNEGFELPAGAELLVRGDTFPNQAYRFGEAAFGLQFHPEVTWPMVERWMGVAGHMLAAPGADPAHRQRDDDAAHGPAMRAWLAEFLDRRLLAREPVGEV
ncbi:MAG: glutamine amidotransferase [Ectothiorhodospiraceae bacterium]|nr:glutamine amidotransferase [Ectothiorhodospiraceae bacterium]